MSKIRGLKRKWLEMRNELYELSYEREDNINEIFIAQSFEYSRKINLRHKKELVNDLLEIFDRKTETGKYDYLIWFDLDDIMESSIMIFKDSEEFKSFVSSKMNYDEETDNDFFLKVVDSFSSAIYEMLFERFDKKNMHIFKGGNISEGYDKPIMIYMKGDKNK